MQANIALQRARLAVRLIEFGAPFREHVSGTFTFAGQCLPDAVTARASPRAAGEAPLVYRRCTYRDSAPGTPGATAATSRATLPRFQVDPRRSAAYPHTIRQAVLAIHPRTSRQKLLAKGFR